MNQRKAIRIGVIADTHGLFDPAIRRHFKGVDLILHAGDIGDRSVIEQLEQIAPVTAVQPAFSILARLARNGSYCLGGLAFLRLRAFVSSPP